MTRLGGRQLLIGDGKTTELNGRRTRVRPCAAIEAALLSSNDDSLARRRRELAESADWSLRLARISEIIEARLAARKRNL